MSYNERLFDNKGLRSYFHGARFVWIQKKLELFRRGPLSIFEIGCFDGRLLRYLPSFPSKYLGIDADWEGGLSSLQGQTFPDNIRFIRSDRPEDLNRIPSNEFDVSVSLETLEHLPPEVLDDYIREIARITRHKFFVSVPNEKGIVFLTKYLSKKLFFGGVQRYTVKEVFYATFGSLSRVDRDEHKGFDYSELARTISRHFEIESVEPIPFSFLPTCFGFTIGIVATKRL